MAKGKILLIAGGIIAVLVIIFFIFVPVLDGGSGGASLNVAFKDSEGNTVAVPPIAGAFAAPDGAIISTMDVSASWEVLTTEVYNILSVSGTLKVIVRINNVVDPLVVSEWEGTFSSSEETGESNLYTFDIWFICPLSEDGEAFGYVITIYLGLEASATTSAGDTMSDAFSDTQAYTVAYTGTDFEVTGVINGAVR